MLSRLFAKTFGDTEHDDPLMENRSLILQEPTFAETVFGCKHPKNTAEFPGVQSGLSSKLLDRNAMRDIEEVIGDSTFCDDLEAGGLLELVPLSALKITDQ